MVYINLIHSKILVYPFMYIFVNGNRARRVTEKLLAEQVTQQATRLHAECNHTTDHSKCADKLVRAICILDLRVEAISPLVYMIESRPTISLCWESPSFFLKCCSISCPGRPCSTRSLEFHYGRIWPFDSFG